MTPLIGNILAADRLPLRRACERPVAGLAGSVLEGRFRHWQGADGRRHLFSVFPLGPGAGLDDVPRFEDAVLLAVVRDAQGRRHILFADETGSLPDLVFGGTGLRAAVLAGANEIHVHLLADTPAARAALLRDLRRS